MVAERECMFVPQVGVDAIKYSPRDSYIVTFEKFNVNIPEKKNLNILCTKTGRVLASFEYRKSAKEAMSSFMWSPDEQICLRLVPPGTPPATSNSTQSIGSSTSNNKDSSSTSQNSST